MYKQILCISLNEKYLFRMFCGLQNKKNPTQFFRETFFKKIYSRNPENMQIKPQTITASCILAFITSKHHKGKNGKKRKSFLGPLQTKLCASAADFQIFF